MGSCLASDVVRIAKGEIGYKESGNNWTKYAKDLDAVKYFNTPKQNIAWCATFCYWCILKACTPEDRSDGEKKWDALYFTYQPSKDNCACGCKYGAGYFRAKGAWYSKPKVGDIVFFGSKGNETHQGIVTQVSGNSFYTVEGNKSDKVCACSYTLGSSTNIAGFGRPRYDAEPEPTPPTPPTPTYTAEQAMKDIEAIVKKYNG